MPSTADKIARQRRVLGPLLEQQALTEAGGARELGCVNCLQQPLGPGEERGTRALASLTPVEAPFP